LAQGVYARCCFKIVDVPAVRARIKPHRALGLDSSDGQAGLQLKLPLEAVQRPARLFTGSANRHYVGLIIHENNMIRTCA